MGLRLTASTACRTHAYYQRTVGSTTTAAQEHQVINTMSLEFAPIGVFMASEFLLVPGRQHVGLGRDVADFQTQIARSQPAHQLVPENLLGQCLRLFADHPAREFSIGKKFTRRIRLH